MDYDQAKSYVANGKLLRRAVQEKSMPPIGSQQAASITEEERQMIGRWVEGGGLLNAEQTPQPMPASQTSTSIGQTVENCLHCHGSEGPTFAESQIPIIAGQSEEYLVNQLQRYKWRARVDPSTSMNEIGL